MAKTKKQTKITKKISFADLMQEHPEAIEILLDKGMHCIGCPMATGENLEQGAIAHGLDPDKLVEEINSLLLEKDGDKKDTKKEKK